MGGNFLRRACCHQGSAPVAPFGTQINDMIRHLDYVQVCLLYTSDAADEL